MHGKHSRETKHAPVKFMGFPSEQTVRSIRWKGDPLFTKSAEKAVVFNLLNLGILLKRKAPWHHLKDIAGFYGLTGF